MYLYPEWLTRLIHDGDSALTVLLILIFMVPMEAIDGLLVALFASFARPRAIFFRKHILGPALKLMLVALLVTFDSGLMFLAYGWLAINIVGIALYLIMLVTMMRERGILRHFNYGLLNLPVREIFAFTIPLMTSDLVTIVMHSVDTLLLGYFHGISEVAEYRVILPAAHLNTIVMASFSLLYTPVSARLFARNDFVGINSLYWKTAVWMSLLSFPIFALTFSLARPLTVFLYGARYESSWTLLAMISLGYYFNVVLGFNGLTLKVLGHVRYVVVINGLAAAINAVLVLLLVPRYGAFGAALGTALAMIAHNVLKQIGLKRAADLHVFEWQYFSLYVTIMAGTVSLFVVQYLLDPNIYISVSAAAAVSAAVVLVCRKKLDVQGTFPELLRLPLMRQLFGSR